MTLPRATRLSYPLRRNAAWLRALPAILFSQEKDAKVIQGVRPLDIPQPLPGRDDALTA